MESLEQTSAAMAQVTQEKQEVSIQAQVRENEKKICIWGKREVVRIVYQLDKCQCLPFLIYGTVHLKLFYLPYLVFI